MPSSDHAIEPVGVAIISGAVVLSSVLYSMAGVQFDATPLALYWQYLPIEVLREDLARGLLALHSQPPLFNLFLGVGLKTPAPLLFYELSFTLATIVLGISMTGILRGLGCGRGFAVAASVVFLSSPTSVMYAHWLFYSWFEAAALTAAVAALMSWRGATSPTASSAAFALFGATLAGLRALFHPAWAGAVLVLIGVLAWRLGRRLTRVEVIGLAVPLLVGLAVMGKNVWLIGEATTSSWTGMNVSHVAFREAPAAEIDRLIASGRLSPLARIGGFLPPGTYVPYEAELPHVEVNWRLATHPALARPVKNGGQPNFNYVGYVRISRRLWRDAVTYIVANPRRYAANVAASLRQFARPASDYAFLEPNRTRLAPWTDWVRRIVYPDGRGWLIWCAVLIAVLGGLVVAWSRSVRATDGTRFAALFVATTVTWFIVVGNGLEFGENNRFRVAIDPLLYCSVCACACGMVSLARRQLRWPVTRPRAWGASNLQRPGAGTGRTGAGSPDPIAGSGPEAGSSAVSR